MSNNPRLPEPPDDMSDLEATIFTGSQPGVYKVGDETFRAPLITDEQIRELKPQGRMAPPIKNRAQPRRATREKLLDRRDWKTIAVTAGFCGLASFACGLLGIVFGLWIT